MPSIISKISKRTAAVSGFGIGLVTVALYIRHWGRQNAKKTSSVSSYVTEKKVASKKIAVDARFWQQFNRLLKIIVPQVLSAECGFAVLVAGLLIVRTYFDILMLQITTSIERAITSRDNKGFSAQLLRFLAVMVPVSCVNSLLKYGQMELALRFRIILTEHLYDRYLKGFTYYRISNLDNRIANAEQLLTQDVERFCTSVADLYSNITKPLLDIIIYAQRLSTSIGVQGPSTMMLYLLGSGMFLTTLRQPTGSFTVNEQRLEGNFRYINSRLVTHSEEVAFYNGNDRETAVVSDSFARLVQVVRKSQQFRYSIGVVDSIVAKYFATVVGYLLVARPFLDLGDERFASSSHAEIMEEYFKSGKMMMNFAQAMGRLVLAGRELTRLAGFTARVTDLMTVLDELNRGEYKRTMVQKRATPAITQPDEETGGVPESAEETKQFSKQKGKKNIARKPSIQDLHLKPNAGSVRNQDLVIEFKEVPLVTPNGDVLVPSMSFKVESGMNVLVCGPNGCGKSSLFRTLGELWPLFGGELVKPPKEKLFYIPQRPYLPLGSLRDQILYPHSQSDMHSAGKTDDDLLQYLKLVHLEYLVAREGGWDVVSDWSDVLSGGEKQRVAMARLFYHRPQFAILDECTSAVSVDVEGLMYSHCRKENITLFTVSHRKSLWAYHEYVLSFDGRGNYDFKRIDPSNTDHFGS